jgi:protein involved in polysaccharide export with SLBB domain
MNRRLRTACVAAVSGVALVSGGCILDVPSFIDPGELAGLRTQKVHEPLVVQVLDELDPVLEQGNKQFTTAEPPRPEDLETQRTDYVVGPQDLLQITIYDLEGPGLQTIKNTRVSGTGNITLPWMNNVVRAEGLTELELQQAISQAYQQAGVLENANVSVAVAEARNRAYSVLGSVARPNQYVITDEDFRLLDALTAVGDVTSPLIDELYIVRKIDRGAHATGQGAMPTSGPTTRPAGAAPGAAPASEPADQLAPPQSNSRRLPKAMKKSVLLQAAAPAGTNDPLVPGAAPAPAADAPAAAPADAPAAAPADTSAPAAAPADAPAAPANLAADDSTRIGRIDGQAVVVQPTTEAAAPAAEGTAMVPTSEPFEFEDLPAPADTRVIRIPLDKLKHGDLRYTVAIHPHDTIIVPPGIVGFYYMSGHVNQGGAFQFSGQRLTLLQAVDSSRGLDGLAIPQRTDIVRKIGPNQQMFYRVDLAKIAAGEAPDIYLKPNDRVVVGTNFLAPFLAAVRGGFRMTYGFGFLYDRNFAYSDNAHNL